MFGGFESQKIIEHKARIEKIRAIDIAYTSLLIDEKHSHQMSNGSKGIAPIDFGWKRLVVAGKQRLDCSAASSGEKQPRNLILLFRVEPWLRKLRHSLRRVMVGIEAHGNETTLVPVGRTRNVTQLCQTHCCERADVAAAGIYESEKRDLAGQQVAEFISGPGLIEHDTVSGGLDHRQPIAARCSELVNVIVGRPYNVADTVARCRGHGDNCSKEPKNKSCRRGGHRICSLKI